MGDFNEDVYEDRLATHIAEDDLRMLEQCLLATGQKLPPTFSRGGTKPIDDVFATAGINCVNATIFEKYGGMGDHRLFALDIVSASTIGDVFPRVVPPVAR